MRVHVLTALAVSIPFGLITVFLMSIALKAHANKVVTGPQGLVGDVGLAHTDLSPRGKVSVHGELWDGVASVQVPAGQPIVVRKVEGLELQVDPAPPLAHVPSSTGL